MVRFLAFGIILYLSWLAIYEWWIHPAEWVDHAVVSNTLSFSQTILGWMGISSELEGLRVIKIPGTAGLFLGDSCNGLSLFALFGIFIIAFPGPIKNKLWFIPAGILLIHVLNIVRIVLLSLILTVSYEWTEFNHTYTFTIVIYLAIFGMWLFWINRYSGIVFNRQGK